MVGMFPERKAVANFLQEVTSRKDQRQCWERESRPYKFVTVKEFVVAFQSFHVGQRIGEELICLHLQECSRGEFG